MAVYYNTNNGMQPKRRNVFFSFHYADIMRVNNVRNCGKFKTERAASIIYGDGVKSIEGFYDYSLWESRKLNGSDALKRMIREGVENTSAVCVLVGSQTYARRWVRYEIARSVIDGRGLLAVHLNSINHHTERRSHTHGPNPLDYIGVLKRQDTILSIPTYYLCEKDSNGTWTLYQDYTMNVNKPIYLPEPVRGQITPLSRGTSEHDYVGGNGYANIAHWIDAAATQAGY